MIRRAAILILSGLVLLALPAGCSMMSNTSSVPPKHPEDLAAFRADCRECHDDVSTGALKPYASIRHSGVFIRQHGLYAAQGQNLCQACHQASFCQTCHAGKDELTPNIRMGDRPDMMLPHRGDYIVQHRIDGRLDPGSCFRCHGNRDNAKCRVCHR